MAPGHWRTPERDKLLDSTLRIVNGILAVSSLWLMAAFAQWSILLVLDLFK